METPLSVGIPGTTFCLARRTLRCGLSLATPQGKEDPPCLGSIGLPFYPGDTQSSLPQGQQVTGQKIFN